MTLHDLHARFAADTMKGRPKRFMALRLIKALFFDRAHRELMALLAVRSYAADNDWRRIEVMLDGRIQKRFGCYISEESTIGPGLKTPHPIGIVIGTGVVVGKRCMIYQHVTLGGARRGDGEANRYPQIGDDVTIFAGAVIAGSVRIGNGATIGANSVVLKDVPDGATAVGAPARIISAP